MGKPHATKSFEQLVAKANRDALKPYINELFMDLANNLSQRLFSQLANIQTRIMALESILISKLNVTEQEIQLKVAEIEDEATGYRAVTRPAQENDLLRVSIQTKAETDKEFNPPVKQQINKLMSQPPTLPETIEKALVGVSAGETKEVTLENNFLVRITVNRISEKVVQEETKAEVQAEAVNESANA